MLKASGKVQFEVEWPKMKPRVACLLQQEDVSKQDWQDLFMKVFYVVSWDDSSTPKMYENLQADITAFIEDTQKRVMVHKEDSALLRAYITEWTRFFAQTKILPEPFRFLEQHMGSSASAKKQENAGVGKVRKLMLDCWSESLFNSIKMRLQVSAMKLIQQERSGEAFDAYLVTGVRESYVNLCSDEQDRLQIYRDNFEQAYLLTTAQYYRAKAAEYLEEHGVEAYMQYAEGKLAEEEARAMRYLETFHSSSSVAKLVKYCVDELVGQFKEVILHQCPDMIKKNDTEKLRLMFHLMDRLPDGILPMLANLQDHIKSEGLSDMMGAAPTIVTDSEKYVERLLELFNRFSLVVKTAFNDNTKFLAARDKAFKEVVNDTSVFRLDLPLSAKGPSASKTQPESKCPELLANFCDMLLRKTAVSKKLTSDELEVKLKNVLQVLKYVQNKDVFMKYYKAHLTRRLILHTSMDNDIEENMVEWLREIGMPAEYVNRLARMFQDIQISQDLNQEFKDTRRSSSHEPSADAVNIKILNAAAWSRGTDRIPASLPPELQDYVPDIEEFYKSKHSGRKLQWNYLMSNGTITMANDCGKFDLDVTTFQMIVLFLWNERPREKLTFESMLISTELPAFELRRTLWSLVAFPKMKKQILLYSPTVSSAKDFKDSTEFWINHKFDLAKKGQNQRRGKCSLIGRLQLSAERTNEEENAGIAQLRVLRVQEAIMKIMKMRKKYSNAALQTELVQMMKNMFLPSKKLIKEQIEWLIENKYLGREEGDINSFFYIA